MTKILFFGDLHGNVKGTYHFIEKIKPDFLFSTGDLEIFKDLEEVKKDTKSLKNNCYCLLKDVQKFPIPFYSLKGNHDDFNNIYSDDFKEKNIFYVKQGEKLQLGDYSIICLGGIYSPRYIVKDSSTFKDREKRFFTYEEINKAKSHKKADILITHCGAEGYLDSRIAKEGNKEIKDLVENLDIKYYIYGHHHKNYRNIINSVEIYGLGNFRKNFLAYLKLP